jgi:hypothetical protein
MLAAGEFCVKRHTSWQLGSFDFDGNVFSMILTHTINTIINTVINTVIKDKCKSTLSTDVKNAQVEIRSQR